MFCFCINECPKEKKLIWNIYFGRINSTQNFTKWILFDQMTNFENICSFSKWNSLEIRSYLSIRRNQQFIIWSSITNFNLSSITVTKEAFSGLLSSNLNQNGIPLTTISVSSLFSQVNLLVSNFSKKSTNKPIVVKISSNLSHLFN